MERRTVLTRRPVDLPLTLGGLRHGGPRDRTMRVGPTHVWRAINTTLGPATLHLRRRGPCTIEARVWGPGALAAIEGVPALVGADDDPPPLARAHPLVTDLERRLDGLRIGRSGAVFEAIAPVVLAQRVIGAEASFAYRAMVRAAGVAAPAGAGPGGADLLLPPDPRWVASTPYWTFHTWGVERRRADTVRFAASRAHRLEETVNMSSADARRRLGAFPGVGPWTVNNVAMLALGDADAVSVGDYWLKHVVSYALTGEPRGTDERMLELLEPWRGQRGRVCRLLLAGAPPPPRFGPRLPLRQLAAH
jgi:3-methyladenine DNA glycosylase/8-oxoguanine DNA glycosylase